MVYLLGWRSEYPEDFTFGSPDEVREEVKYLIEVFGNSGFVWNAVHTIQGKYQSKI